MTGDMAEEMALVTFFFATTEEELAKIILEPQPMNPYEPINPPESTPEATTPV